MRACYFVYSSGLLSCSISSIMSSFSSRSSSDNLPFVFLSVIALIRACRCSCLICFGVLWIFSLFNYHHLQRHRIINDPFYMRFQPEHSCNIAIKNKLPCSVDYLNRCRSVLPLRYLCYGGHPVIR